MWSGCIAFIAEFSSIVYISASHTNGTYGPAYGFGESVVMDVVVLRRLNVSLIIKVCGVTLTNIAVARLIQSLYVCSTASTRV